MLTRHQAHLQKLAERLPSLLAAEPKNLQVKLIPTVALVITREGALAGCHPFEHPLLVGNAGRQGHFVIERRCRRCNSAPASWRRRTSAGGQRRCSRRAGASGVAKFACKHAMAATSRVTRLLGSAVGARLGRTRGAFCALPLRCFGFLPNPILHCLANRRCHPGLLSWSTP